jgi:hypothetical protein
MQQYRFILIMALSLLLYTAVVICAQPRYTGTDLGDFSPEGIAGPWVVGGQWTPLAKAVRLNLDTGQEQILADFGHGGWATAVLPTGEATGYIWFDFGQTRAPVAAFISDDGRIIGVQSRLNFTEDEDRGFPLIPFPAEPAVAISVNQASFTPGQTLHATITTQDAAGLQLYVGAIFPDGDTTLLLTQLSPMAGEVVRLSTSNSALFSHVNGPPQSMQAFAHTFTGLENPGTYHLVAALVPPGAFEDGIIHGEDLVAFDWQAISVQGTALMSKMLAIRDKHA